MGSARSGAQQYLSVDSVVVSAVGNGFSGLDIPVDPATFTVVGGGLMTTRDGGTITASGSFTAVETETTNSAFLGANGKRSTIVWRPYGSGLQWAFDAIITRSRTFADRGERSYSVDILLDGAPTRTTA